MLSVVVGTGRCGSTLVQELLSRHPGVGFVSGLDDKLSRLNLAGRFNGALYRRSAPRPAGMTSLKHSRRLLERGRLRVAPSEAYELLDRHVMGGYSRPCRDLLADDLTPYVARRLRGFFDGRIERQGCRVLLQHVTGWPRTGFLGAAYPELRVINVVRDGRAVANSWLQMGWWDGWRGPDAWLYGPLPPALRAEWESSGRSFPVLAALGWKMLMAAFAEARAVHPAGQWLDVRYEDLIAAPREELRRMLDFLGLDWSPAFEKGFGRYTFHAGRGAAYRDELSPAQLAAVERVLAEPLAAWGYPAAETFGRSGES
ncbi:Sulfotransferase family protein [Micromonospora pattaloongensis]|uniref:Sulfotransferase family protein n=1 Tax=Micromonospora pattaloongensis TaxID=405436 RepID=A0A1H3RG37_9ACTN|nr:sulfotransferase [Micromonospora pattaloongensis]SDZ24616.1 Sulfotransferase family protein [Micromonospora pattaloongensis]